MTQNSAHWFPDGFSLQDGVLHCEEVAVPALAAQFGAPCYVYSAGHIRRRLAEIRAAFSDLPHLTCFAVKANDNHGILQLCADVGCGFDVVSGGELQRALRTGVDPNRIVFSGVGKQDSELELAIRSRILSINIESEAEAARLIELAAQGTTEVDVAVRINPDIDPRTHPKIATGMGSSKFGVAIERALALYEQLAAAVNVRPRGLAFHIGSQLLHIDPILDALDRALAMVDRLAANGIVIERLDLGGGVGIRYSDADQPIDLPALGSAITQRLADFGGTIVLEPGRFVVGNSGALCTSVLYEKSTDDGQTMLVVDAAMNDLLRPAMYDATHAIVPVAGGSGAAQPTTVVGPICESSDVFARDVPLPTLPSGGLLAILSAGAYGSVMAGTYNSRPRLAELLVDGNRVLVMRERETLEQLLARDRTEADWVAVGSRPGA